MKSTGLFGKNSGRVGGVVYSNYRGQQIVRAYQPQVKNPNTPGQIEQRAKFKLVSQVASSLGEQITLSYLPDFTKESSRNSFVKAMLKRAVYSNGEASLPIEDVIITNSRSNWFSRIDPISATVSGVLIDSLRDSENVRVRVVFLGYNEGGLINVLNAAETATVLDEGTNTRRFSLILPTISGYSNVRALIYAYRLDLSDTTYDDYMTNADEATLDIVKTVYKGAILFSETRNIAVPQNV